MNERKVHCAFGQGECPGECPFHKHNIEITEELGNSFDTNTARAKLFKRLRFKSQASPKSIIETSQKCHQIKKENESRRAFN